MKDYKTVQLKVNKHCEHLYKLLEHLFVSLGPKSELKWFPNFSQSSQEWTFLCDTFAKVYS